jgi:hypothetical protein
VPAAAPAAPAPAPARPAPPPPQAAAPTSAKPPAPPAPAPRAAAPLAVPAPGAPAKKPINPFLANDPNSRARRLARALISDLITYFPKKRDEGLRDGTLKELFKEEIKKSFEEYQDQVGKEFATSTPHFTDALNEILAKGQKMFG